MISGRDTLFSEKITKEYRHGKVFYMPVVTGQNNGEAVVFTLVDVKSGQWVFALKHSRWSWVYQRMIFQGI